ncbi:MAG: FAD-dependent oxidoreductase [Myxococcota bacterium]
MPCDVVVVGSGVSGLSCAYELARAGASVEIVARSVPPATTSNVAAAFWYPYFAFPRERVLSWAARSWHRFAALAERPQTGIRMADAVELLRASGPRPSSPPLPWWCDAAASVKRAPADWLPPGFSAGWHFVGPVVDTRSYLPWLRDEVAALGVGTTQREVRTIAGLFDRAPVVVDCAGLGARSLVPDPSVTPVRGQIVVVENPGLSRVVLDENDPAGVTYVVPRGDDCVLGGTTEPGVEHTTASLADRHAVRSRCIALEPRLADARVLADVVGLRPGRSAVRLEAEPTARGLVVHNYGHGGAGVTLSWGCAQEVSELVFAHGHRRPGPRAPLRAGPSAMQSGG